MKNIEVSKELERQRARQSRSSVKVCLRKLELVVFVCGKIAIKKYTKYDRNFVRKKDYNSGRYGVRDQSQYQNKTL